MSIYHEARNKRIMSPLRGSDGLYFARSSLHFSRRICAALEQNRMLREGEPKDAEEIGQVRVSAWRAAYQQFMPEAYLEALDPTNKLPELKERLSNQSSDFILSVAEEHKQVVAFSIVGKPRFKAPAKAIELWAVDVLPKYWRMGIGSRLVERAVTCSFEFEIN